MGLVYFSEFDLFENLNYLLELYDCWENSFKSLKSFLNIDCKSFCSKCCNTNIKNIQSTIFEMLPAAIFFYKIIFELNDKNNKYNNDLSIENFLSKKISTNKKITANNTISFNEIKNSEHSKIFQKDKIINNVYSLLFENKIFTKCVFYTKSNEDWGCSIYEFRPAICRLFGFSLKRNKKNNLIFSPCKELKEEGYKKSIFEDEDLLLKNLKDQMSSVIGNSFKNLSFQIPIYDRLYFNLLSLNYSYTKEFYDLNTAFKKAFEIVYLKLNFNNKKIS